MIIYNVFDQWLKSLPRQSDDDWWWWCAMHLKSWLEATVAYYTAPKLKPIEVDP